MAFSRECRALLTEYTEFYSHSLRYVVKMIREDVGEDVLYHIDVTHSFIFFSFFPFVVRTQLNHWNKWVVNPRFIT